MARILVVDNGGQWTHREWRVLKYLGVDTEIVPRDTPFEKLGEVDGLVLSGGAPTGVTLETMGENPRYLAKAPYPVLGVCAGAQVMGLHYGGRLFPAKAPEFGKAEIEVREHGRLFEGLPSRFIAWENHNDEVSLPEGFTLLATSKSCGMQAMEDARRMRYAVQFHPEVEHTEHGSKIFENFVALCRK